MLIYNIHLQLYCIIIYTCNYTVKCRYNILYNYVLILYNNIYSYLQLHCHMYYILHNNILTTIL